MEHTRYPGALSRITAGITPADALLSTAHRPEQGCAHTRACMRVPVTALNSSN